MLQMLLMTALENDLERKEMCVLYGSLEEKKLMYVSCNGIER